MADIHLRISREAFAWALAAGLLCAAAAELRTESFTLSTYYPAPSGVYNKMITTGGTYLARDNGSVTIGATTVNLADGLFRFGQLPDDPDKTTSDEGSVYFNISSHVFRGFQNGAWIDLGAGGGAGGQALYRGPTSSSYSGGDHGSLQAANRQCDASYAGSHMCFTDEVLHATADLGNGWINPSTFTYTGFTFVGPGSGHNVGTGMWGSGGITVGCNDYHCSTPPNCNGWAAASTPDGGPNYALTSGLNYGEHTDYCGNKHPILCCK